MFVLIFLALESYWLLSQPQPCPPTQIYRGITYSCEELSQRGEGYGLVHIVVADLSAQGIAIYLTPVEPEAVAGGFQYRLARAASVLDRERLAVVVNATLFSSNSGLLQWPGDWARGIQTIVADGKVSHVDPYCYLLWFEADLTPHIESKRPPDNDTLRRARWGVGGYAALLHNGRVEELLGPQSIEKRTAVGIDGKRRLLWLAVFENASEYAAMRTLAKHGARDGIMLDGGHSTAMVLGRKAAQGKSGAVLGGFWPTATFLGVKAESL